MTICQSGGKHNMKKTKKEFRKYLNNAFPKEKGLWKNGRYHQIKREYGDYLYYQDRIMFDNHYDEWLAELKKEENKKKTQTIFPCWNNGIKSYEEGGKIQCDVCKSFEGIKTRRYYRKITVGNGYFKLAKRCVNCGSFEAINENTGEILKQEKKGGNNV